VLKNTDEICAATTEDLSKVLIYVPVNTVLKLNADLSGYEFTLIELEQRRVAEVTATVENNMTIIGMHNFTCDVLLIGKKIDEVI
jgi:hypothetical protein